MRTWARHSVDLKILWTERFMGLLVPPGINEINQLGRMREVDGVALDQLDALLDTH